MRRGGVVQARCEGDDSGDGRCKRGSNGCCLCDPRLPNNPCFHHEIIIARCQPDFGEADPDLAFHLQSQSPPFEPLIEVLRYDGFTAGR